MNETIYSIPWEQYADEAEHYSYVRCLDLGRIYEVVRVTHDKHGPRAEFVHQVIFMDEYDEQALTEILSGFGYKSLDAFVCEVNHADVDPAGFVVRRNGSIDREASPSWWIDYMLLASLMAEHFDGRKLLAEIADRLADSIVRKAPDAAIGPYCIRRTVADQRTTIPLTEDEVNRIYAVKDAQVQIDYLRDEISELDGDDSCFDGCNQERLTENEEFLKAVQARWYHYNGHGGDHAENLREAITVTIHELGLEPAGT